MRLGKYTYEHRECRAKRGARTGVPENQRFLGNKARANDVHKERIKSQDFIRERSDKKPTKMLVILVESEATYASIFAELILRPGPIVDAITQDLIY